jgi:NTP pyrophosphatase (non-canonical NTP hydrolase)
MHSEYKGFSESPTLEDLRRKLIHFAEERDWNKYHTPRNLCLSLVAEIGELCECFQWRGEVEEGLPGCWWQLVLIFSFCSDFF